MLISQQLLRLDAQCFRNALKQCLAWSAFALLYLADCVVTRLGVPSKFTSRPVQRQAQLTQLFSVYREQSVRVHAPPLQHRNATTNARIHKETY